MSLFIQEEEGETAPKRRRRIANAIVDLLEREDLLRAEIASQLGLNQTQLNHTVEPELEEKEIYTEL